MTEKERTRREILKVTSAAVAGAALTGSAAAEARKCSTTRPADSSRILNYNPKMGYRRLGKTGIMISEISLGGHGSMEVENRAKILERAAGLGINYLDTNIVKECEVYGEALRGKRKNWHIGFASWPQKVTT
ncbi:MAG: hypothetical protein JSV03_15795 [Planctomycetota bacterium]|nr:MAG: hypothetical protein JSV03_15795 [Planctomycetota bacterium]